ncbi:MAG: periplasmic heavy metal sensor [Pseudomonadales bacterium]|nr:periplasmic heavy metal sensor [Pseudomonadales bacterium]
MNKWILGGLTLSLCLNVGLAGFIIGEQHGPRFRGPDPVNSYPRWARHLEEQRRAELAPLLRAPMQMRRSYREQLRQRHQDVRSQLAATPFDLDALERSLNNLNSELTAQRDLSQQAFLRFVQQLDEAERRSLADAMHRRRGPPQAKPPPNRPEPRPVM